MTDPYLIQINEERTVVTIDDTTFILQVEENNNIVTVDEENPNLVFVSTVGTQGAPGRSVITGSGNPDSSDGSAGDIYIDTETGAFWGPKTTSGWPASPFYTAGNTRRHVHNQASAASTWTISHTLGGRPSVTVVDSASTTVIGEVSYLSDSVVQVDFTAPFSGYAYLT